MAFTDILNYITDTTEREALAAVAEKYPTFRAVAEDGERYQGLRANLTAAGIAADKMESAISNVPAMFKWTAENFDFKEGMTNNEKLARAEKAEFERQYNELLAKGDTEMDLDQIIAGLKERGIAVSRDDLKAFPTKAELNVTLEAQSQRFEQLYSALTPKMVGHQNRFGEPLPAKDIFKFMQDRGVSDPNEAYELFMAPKVALINEADTVKRIAEAEERGRLTGRSEAAATLGRRDSMPIDSGGGSGNRPSGFAARKMAARASADSGEDKLGSGVTAAKYTQSFMQKQANAGSV